MDCRQSGRKGCSVRGIKGYRMLRGEQARIRFRPKRFWTRLSDLSQISIRDHPRYAFHLLAVKNLR
ncbi:hypothetical protein GF351_00545 [Candidatus Woesearchaeota archaeon]|nr:hypothetical protein [Candidatus Woesearchaeota archaeon]